MQEHVHGRTDAQCREKWTNVLDPDVRRAPWSPADDAALEAAVAAHGVGAWSKVAARVAGRTDNQCWRRWAELNAGERAARARDQRKRRDVLPLARGGASAKRARGADHEARATELGPGDFMLGLRHPA